MSNNKKDYKSYKKNLIPMYANLMCLPFYFVIYEWLIPIYNKEYSDSASGAIILVTPIILISIILQIISLVLDIKSIISYFKNKSKGIKEKLMIYLNALNIVLTLYVAKYAINILSLYFQLFMQIKGN